MWFKKKHLFLADKVKFFRRDYWWPADDNVMIVPRKINIQTPVILEIPYVNILRMLQMNVKML